MPTTATDVGALFVSAHRVIFDRLRIPTLSLAEERRVLFLDSLEVGETSGTEFVLNQMSKHPENPVLSPGPPGSKDDRYGGVENFLDVDDPYGTRPAVTPADDRPIEEKYTMRGQVFLDACAGKGEDQIYCPEVKIVEGQIYAADVRFAEGLYFCFYWPGIPGRPLAAVGIAVSRDGFNFTRVKNGERTLPIGPPGSWDSGYIFQMGPMVDGDVSQVHRRQVCHCRPAGRQCVVKGVRPCVRMCNGACTVERNARQWHTDNLLSYRPACHVWLERDRLSMDSIIVLSSNVTK